MCVRRGRADGNRNVKKLSYATPPTGSSEPEQRHGSSAKAPWGKGEGGQGEGGREKVCVCVCVCAWVRVAACRPARTR